MGLVSCMLVGAESGVMGCSGFGVVKLSGLAVPVGSCPWGLWLSAGLLVWCMPMGGVGLRLVLAPHGVWLQGLVVGSCPSWVWHPSPSTAWGLVCWGVRGFGALGPSPPWGSVLGLIRGSRPLGGRVFWACRAPCCGVMAGARRWPSMHTSELRVLLEFATRVARPRRGYLTGARALDWR